MGAILVGGGQHPAGRGLGGLAGHLDAPGMGYIYVTPLDKAATYIPEQVQERLRKGA